MTRGAHSIKCSICKGIKKSAASDRSSPAQINQPDVPSSGLILIPFRGRTPSLTFFEMPTFNFEGAGTNGEPYRAHTSACISKRTLSIAKSI
uniref:zinc finger domain-containing protein n=1 Tax=Amantichitinum ursilacus TaxID=857265 RepID=UPI00128F07C3